MSETFWARATRPYIISTLKSGFGINYWQQLSDLRVPVKVSRKPSRR
jgi:hypothetical protein